MDKKTGINFENCNITTAELHNARDKKYLDAVDNSGKKTYDLFHDRTPYNSTWINPEYAGKSLTVIYDECRKRYIVSVHQSPQEKTRIRIITDKKTGCKKTVKTAGWSPIREGVCPVKENTVISDFKPFISWMEGKGVHIIRIDIHVDEGYQDPVTGTRKYNYHAHAIADWTNHLSGRTAKLSKIDTSEMQTVLAESLGMERGNSKMETGIDHLSAPRFREKKAAKHAKELEEENLKREKDLAEKKKEIKECEKQIEQKKLQAKALEEETSAKRKKFRNNAADVGARVLGLIGRGAIAEAKKDREAKATAEQDAAEAREAAELAQEAQRQAEYDRNTAEKARRTAENQKSAYGREMYEKGVTDGVKQGQQSAQASIAPLQEQLAAKQKQLDQATQRAETAEKEVKDMEDWNPSMQNWQQSVRDMQIAGMSRDQIQQVFRRGFLEGVKVPIFKHQGKIYTEEAKVSLNPSTNGGMVTWFNGSRRADFTEKAVEKVKKLLGLNRGMRM